MNGEIINSVTRLHLDGYFYRVLHVEDYGRAVLTINILFGNILEAS